MGTRWHLSRMPRGSEMPCDTWGNGDVVVMSGDALTAPAALNGARSGLFLDSHRDGLVGVVDKGCGAQPGAVGAPAPCVYGGCFLLESVFEF